MAGEKEFDFLGTGIVGPGSEDQQVAVYIERGQKETIGARIKGEFKDLFLKEYPPIDRSQIGKKEPGLLGRVARFAFRLAKAEVEERLTNAAAEAVHAAAEAGERAARQAIGRAAENLRQRRGRQAPRTPRADSAFDNGQTVDAPSWRVVNQQDRRGRSAREQELARRQQELQARGRRIIGQLPSGKGRRR